MRTEEELLLHRLRHKFHKTAAEYNLIEEGDRILIAVSGGKDSLALLVFLAELRKYNSQPFDLEAITVETLTPIEAMNELYKLKKML